MQNAAVEGVGLTFLPCYVGDADDRLVRVSDPLEHLDMDLWVLTHNELRNTARIRALMTFLYDALSADADLDLVAEATQGYVGADLAALAREAALNAAAASLTS